MGIEKEFFYKVAVNIPVMNGVLTYTSQEMIIPGQIVEVKIGKKHQFGFVLGLEECPDMTIEYKQLIKSDKHFSLSTNDITFFKWVSSYYQYPLGKLISDCLPNFLTKPQKDIREIKKNTKKDQIILTAKQKEIFEAIKNNFGKTDSRSLILGVTGSGKTLIYLNLIREILNKGKSVLFLLPEINLTSQFIEFFENQLEFPVFVYTSAVTNSKKYKIFKNAKSNRPLLYISVRSGLFIPDDNLGLIIIDEEHDQSYKQEDRCRYHVRESADKKAKILKIPIVFGSATPSFELYHFFKEKDHKNLYILDVRATNIEMPQIDILDMSEKSQKDSVLHINSVTAIKEELNKGNQVMIYVNRLGYSHSIQCKSCGHTFDCKNCHSKLRVFKKEKTLSCSYCDYKEKISDSCPSCGCISFYAKGFGTEQIEEEINKVFPTNKAVRLDRDAVTTQKKLEKVLSDFRSGEYDILIGTKMVTKGHNFPKLTLVIVLGVDQQISSPDFRSYEYAFQSIVQVAGRAGRYKERGKVFIQTLNAFDPFWSFVKEQNYIKFYEHEMKIRKSLGVVPYSRLVDVIVVQKSQQEVIEKTQDLFNFSHYLQKTKFHDINISPTRPYSIEKISNKYYWHFHFSSNSQLTLHNFIQNLKKYGEKKLSTNLRIDVDPINLD